MLSIRILASIGALVLLLGPRTLGAEDRRYDTREQRGDLSGKDYKFLLQVARSASMEVEMGELARHKGTHPAVRRFGERMVADHGQANEELRRIAARRQAMLPARFTHGQNSEMQHFEQASGVDFDRKYAAEMVKHHRDDLKDFEKAARDLNDPDLRDFARRTLPLLQDHLRMAQDMQAAVREALR